VDTTNTQDSFDTSSGFQEGMSIKELLHILKVRMGWIIVAFLLVMGAAVAYLQYVTPMYEAGVTVIVDSLQKSSSIENLLMGQTTTRINTEVELALSRINIESALQLLDLRSYRTADDVPYTDKSALGAVKNRTSVTTVKDTNIVKITVTDQNYTFAADFANALAESYNELLGSIAKSSKTVQKEFIQSQIPLNEKELQKAADALGKFREESGIIQLSDKSKLLSDKIAHFQLRREPLALQLNEAINNIQTYSMILAGSAIDFPRYEQVVGDVDVIRLLSTYKDMSRELALYNAIQDGQAQNQRQFVLSSAIAQTTKALLDRVTLLVAPRGLSADAYIMLNAIELAKSIYNRIVTEADIALLISIEETYAEELSQLPVLERRLLDLQRDVQVYETLRLRLMELLEEVKIAEAAIAGSVRVVDEARINERPVSPNRMLILAVAVLLGAAFGVLLALLIEMLDVTLKDEGVIKKLAGPHIPILGWIPLMNLDREQEIPSLIVYNNPLSFEAERYKLIANNISFGTLRKTKRVFSVTSPGMGEGKTSATANIGTSLAQNGIRVLLIDGDLRLPQLETFFNLRKSHHGLVDIITGNLPAEEVIIQPLADVPFLHVLPPGILPPLPSAIFTAPEYVVLLDHLLETYDYILVDTPPLIFASELMAIAKHVDGLVVNIRAGITTKGAFRELLDNLDIVGVNILGIIFNGVIETKAGGHYTSGRYYTYQGSYYAKRYYETRTNPEDATDEEGKKVKRKKSRSQGKVTRGYRFNFIKDLKAREKARGIGTNIAIHPYVEKIDPFASTVPEKIGRKVVAPLDDAADFLEAVERDPKSSGRQ